MDYDIESLLSELCALRERLQYYEQHHQQCSIGARQPSPPPDEECYIGSLQIITCRPELVKPKLVLDSRWKPAAAQLVQGVPDAAAWIRRRQDLTLENRSAISLISGVSSRSITCKADDPYCHTETTEPADLIASATEFTQCSQEDAGLLASTAEFATITKHSQVDVDLAVTVKTYQEYLLVSTCVVLEKHGINLDEINRVMRISISNSTDGNLRRLRQGAVWLNKIIVELQTGTHWGDRAGEAIFFSRLPISKYGRMSAYKASLCYVVDKLRCAKYTTNNVETLHGMPLSIPVFIKIILKDKLSLQEICNALGYHDFIDEIAELCTQYEAILAPTKRRARNSSQNTLEWENIIVDGQLEWESVYNPYMGAEETAEETTENAGLGPID